MPYPKFSMARWRRFTLAIALLGALMAGCASFEAQQRAWIFQPSKQTWYAGNELTQGLQDVWIAYRSRDDGAPARLHGLWLPQAQPDAPVLLYLHGARWDVRGSAPRIRQMQALGFSVLAIDYRGFGLSTELLPSENTADEDARAAWNWLGAQHPGVKRYVFGHSLGGAIAIRLASEVDDAAGLIVEGTFTSIPDVFQTFKWGWLPVTALITQRFDSASRIEQVKAPVLVVHGSEDRLIPPSLGRALYDRARSPKRFVLVEGGSHYSTNTLGQPQYREALADLFGMRL